MVRMSFGVNSGWHCMPKYFPHFERTISVGQVGLSAMISKFEGTNMT